MNLKQLKYFMAIAEEHQITAAAKKLHIAQPPLSYELSQLEKELGVVLVKRGPRKTELTDAGELLYRRAEQIMAMASAAEREVQSYGKGMSGVLSIGTISSSSGVLPSKEMLEFAKHYPRVRFELREGNTFAIIDMLEKGIIDLGIVREPFAEDRFHCRYSGYEPMVAVRRKEGEAPDSGGSVTLAELAKEPLIIYRRFEHLIYETFKDNGLEPFICCLNDDARTTCAWAMKGFGVGLMPKSILGVMNTDDLIVQDIESEKLTTRLAVIWEKNRYLSPLGQKYIEFFEMGQEIK